MVFLRLAKLFHKFVDKMTLHVLYFHFHEKRITKKNPPLRVEHCHIGTTCLPSSMLQMLLCYGLDHLYASCQLMSRHQVTSGGGGGGGQKKTFFP